MSDLASALRAWGARICVQLGLALALCTGVPSDGAELDSGSDAGSVSVSGSVSVPERPNIVLILADDLGRGVLGSYGATPSHTPNLDALAAAGLRFEHVYATPKCHPSRAELMTGHYPFRIGLVPGVSRRQNFLPYRRLPQLLSEVGYETGIFGKWHLGSQAVGARFPHDFGFDDYSVWEHAGEVRTQGKYWGARLLEPDGPHMLGERNYAPDAIGERAREFVMREREAPFFLYYPMLLIHPPQHTPPGPGFHQVTPEPLTKSQMMIERLDQLVGQLVEAIRASGAAERTLIVFASDNGAVRHAGGGKGTLSDAGTRVPCLMVWPGVIEAGQSSSALVDFSDFLPTLCDLAGCDPGSVGDGDGESFAAHLLSPASEPAPREWVFSEWDGDWFVRDRSWKLYGDGRLVEMREDGGEIEVPARGGAAEAVESSRARIRLERFAAELRAREPLGPPPGDLRPARGSRKRGAVPPPSTPPSH